MNRIDLAGRRAVVTGAARGLGLAIAERLAASGARLSLWDSDRSALRQALARFAEGTLAREVDVTDAAAVEAAAAADRADMGGIDVLIANAGIGGPNLAVWDYPVEAWRRVIDIDLTGVFLCLRAVVPMMREAGYGRIVVMASIAGKEGNPNAGAYSAAKGGVIALVKAAAKELVDTEIRINCVTPALVETDLVAHMTSAHAAAMKARIPLGRCGRPEEIAALVAWLSSEECSFSHGAVFDLSGGRSAY